MQRYHGVIPQRLDNHATFVPSAILVTQLEHFIKLAAVNSSNNSLFEAQLELAWHQILLSLIQQKAGRALLSLMPTHLSDHIRAIIYIDLARDWQLIDIIDKLNMSESTIRHKLKLENLTFNELLIDLRMLEAAKLLIASPLNIQQIALSVGYLSQSRFSARFQKNLGFRLKN